jgi:hypothetical protein
VQLCERHAKLLAHEVKARHREESADKVDATVLALPSHHKVILRKSAHRQLVHQEEKQPLYLEHAIRAGTPRSFDTPRILTSVTRLWMPSGSSLNSVG